MVTGMRAGEDRGVVRQRDGRQRRDRAVLVRGAVVDQPRHVRCLATRRHVVQDVRVRAVEQHTDDVAWPLGRVEHLVEHATVLAGDVPAVRERRAPEERGDGRRDIDEPRRTRHEAVRAYASACDHERCARLDDAERAVLTEVPALVLPVVGRRVQHAQVGRGRGIEQLGDVLVRERICVVAAMRVGPAPLLGEGRERGRRLVGERIVALGRDTFEAVTGAAERDPAVVRARLVQPVPMAAHHVDDRFERGVAQHGECRLRRGPVGVRNLVGRHDLGHGAQLTLHPRGRASTVLREPAILCRSSGGASRARAAPT